MMIKEELKKLFPDGLVVHFFVQKCSHVKNNGKFAKDLDKPLTR